MRIAYILTDFPILSETFIGDEIRAMEARGHQIVPMVFNKASGPSQDKDQQLAARAWRLAESKSSVLDALMLRHPVRTAGAGRMSGCC